MIERLRVSAWAGAAIGLAVGVSATVASPIQYNDQTIDVEGTFGDGSNTSYMVLDYGANDGGLYAFGYRWSDAGTTVHDLFNDLEAASVGFSADLTWYESVQGYLINDLLYNSEAGDSSLGWSIFSWDQTAGDWTGTDLGITELELAGEPVYADADQSAWVVGFHQVQWVESDPGVWSPVGEPRASVIPEPASLVLLAGGGMLALLRRRDAASCG